MKALILILFTVYTVLPHITNITSNKQAQFQPKEDAVTKATHIADGFYYSDAPDISEALSRVCILHYNFEGDIQTGEIIVNSMVAHEVTEIFYKLFKAQYPLASVYPIDEFNGDDEASMSANNTSGYNYRVIAGTNKLSMHAKGLAIDINPLYNPCVSSDGIAPKNGKDYADRSKSFPGKIDKTDLAYKLFTEYGWTWGGNWKSLKDYQHFEKSLS